MDEKKEAKVIVTISDNADDIKISFEPELNKNATDVNSQAQAYIANAIRLAL